MQNQRFLDADARKRFLEVRRACQGTLSSMTPADQQLFLLRLERWFQNLMDGLRPVYGNHPEFSAFLVRLTRKLAEGYAARPAILKELDLERDLTPDWFQRESMFGYVFYVDRFAGHLNGVQQRVDYLEELGVTYVHLMSTLKAREGENDGGYAITDYGEVEPALGTRRDLEATCATLRERGISPCIDLVLNHCSEDHAWARAAREGSPDYQAYFHMFPDRDRPDAFERTLPEVFPDTAPGNFSYVEQLDQWVWTTFHTYQWDLNWTHPEVFLEMVEIMLDLANLGIEVFRLDAVAFMWKRMGTDCQNQPEVHDLLQALRSCSKIATPAVAHKAEAIVGPRDLVRYLGTGRHYGKVANIAYHNSLMVHFWSSLASRDTRLMTEALSAFPPTPASIAWGTYLRCHDDIGWAVSDEDAARVGLDGGLHRAFLSDYYTGVFEGSPARGALFGVNEATGDSRVSGTLASLVGLEDALDRDDQAAVDQSIERILLGHALIFGFGGIPLLYMGDELGLLNDPSYLAEPSRRADSRWLHRPHMDWRAAERRHLGETVEGRIYAGIRALVRARKRTPQLHASHATQIVRTDNPHVFAQARLHPLGTMVGLYNFSEAPQRVDAAVVHDHGITHPFDQLGEASIVVQDGVLELRPYARQWLL